MEGQENIQEVVVEYFTDLLRTVLDNTVTNEEIFTVLKLMKKNKSPGPEGFNVNFFLKCWDIIGTDFTNAAQYLFRSCHLPLGINATATALIPKVENPTSMSDYRPISCCNTIYKCISKVLANKLKKVLPTLIDKP